VAEQDVAGDERRVGGIPEDDLGARQRPDRNQPARPLLADAEAAGDRDALGDLGPVSLVSPEARVGMAGAYLGPGANVVVERRQDVERPVAAGRRELLPLVADQQGI